MGKIATFVELFGPEPRSTGTPEALVGYLQTNYYYPGDALSGNVKYFRLDLGLNSLASCRWLLVWIPNASSSGVRLIHADLGPTNETQIAEFTGNSSTTPIASGVDITSALNLLITPGSGSPVAKILAHQTKGNGTVGPLIFSSTLEFVWNC